MSPTAHATVATQAGMILGTAAYMAPEQARGQVRRQRADIWAFGCVLYEMLTGKRAFEGDTMSEILADVLKTSQTGSVASGDAGWRPAFVAARPAEGSAPPVPRRDMRDARLEIDDVHSAPSGNTGTGAL